MTGTAKNKIWDILEYAFGFVALISLFIFIHLNMIQELHDPDIWIHLKTGEYILQHKAVPQSDIFSATMLGKEWIEHTWLFRVIYYLLFHYAGIDNLLFFSSILVTLSFLILFLSVYTQRRYLTLLVGMLLLTIFASTTRFNIRPENFSLLFFSLYLFILSRKIRTPWLFLLPLIQLAWVNSHIYFILGPFLLGVLLISEKLKRFLILPWEWNKTDLLDKQSYQNLVRIFLLVCLVSFFNAYGWRGVLNPIWINLSGLGKSNIFYHNIQECLPVWRIRYSIIFPYYILAVLSLCTFLLQLRRINIAYFSIWLIFLIISLRVNRFNVFFNFIAFFTAADNLNKNGYLKKLYSSSVVMKKITYILKYIIVIFVIFWIANLNYNRLISRYYIYEENQLKSSLFGIHADSYPVKAADFIVEQNLPGNIFNLFNCGDYLIYRLYPERKVFIDGRTELYGGDFFKEYLKILSLNKNTIETLFKKYNINTVLLNGNETVTAKLTKYLYDSAEWSLVFFDKDSVIYLKNAPKNKPLIDKFKIDLKKWQAPKPDINRIGLMRVFSDSHIERAWMLFYLGLDEQAMNETKQALRILPSSADSYNIISRIYLKRKLYAEAFENLRLAYIYAPLNAETLISLANFYMTTDRTDAAINAYQKLTRFNPYFADGYYFLAQAYEKKNKLDLAIKSLQKAIKLNPFSPEYYEELVELFNRQKNPEQATKIYRKAVALGLDIGDFVDKPNLE